MQQFRSDQTQVCSVFILMHLMETIQLEEDCREGKKGKEKKKRYQRDLSHHCLILKYKSSTRFVSAARDSFHVFQVHYYKIKVQLNNETVWSTQDQDTGSHLQSKYIFCTKSAFKSIQCKFNGNIAIKEWKDIRVHTDL